MKDIDMSEKPAEKAGEKILRGPNIRPMDPDKNYVNPGEDDQMVIEGYKPSTPGTVVTYFFFLLTVGILRLVFHWKPHWMLWSTHKQCSLDEAQMVLLQDEYNQWFVHPVQLITKDGTRIRVLPDKVSYFSSKGQDIDDRTKLVLGPLREESLTRFFINKKLKYIWDYQKNVFGKLRGLHTDIPCSYFHQLQGLSETERASKLVLYGTNEIIVKVMPIIRLLFLQVLNPFYVFQIFSCTLWYNDEYYYYASCILVMSAMSITSYIYMTRKTQRKLRESIKHVGTNLVSIDQVWESRSAHYLVPGDMIEIPSNGCLMTCDAVLISGNCIVNESMLTGESVPVTKTPIPNNSNIQFNMRDHSRSALFSGTQVIQTRYYKDQKVKAIVLRTGFLTAKGELVRSILFPKPLDVRFTHSTFKFIGILAGIAGIGFLYTIILMVLDEEKAGHIVKRSLDLITIAIPPALPAALTIVTVFAQQHLKKFSVYCINPSNIPVCGSIGVVCFDKTGTLTEDGMDIWGLVPALSSRFQDVIYAIHEMTTGPLLSCMGTCHSLTIIEGNISGDPMDVKMFLATDWELDEPGEHDATRFDVFAPTVVRPKHGFKQLEIGIVRQFPFSSSLQRMSVIAKTLGDSNYCLYTKGAPEKIVSLCRPDTVPLNFHEILLQYTHLGYRVIALAWKALPPKLNYLKTQKVARDNIESDMEFLGLLVMENRLKPETTAVIDSLNEADIRTIMVTGDNILTALSVARDCHIVHGNERIITVNASKEDGKCPVIEYVSTDISYGSDQSVSTKEEPTAKIDINNDNRYRFAITGKSWMLVKKYYPEIIPKLAVRGVLFARMSPEQKAQLIEALQEVGYYVGMCGDGANDCGALKMAHAGISLSEAEASLASPFTSTTPNIECVPVVMREGRASLTTTFGILKYMACYSLTQFISVTLLYWIGASVTDIEFLYIDLVLLTSLAITFSKTEPYDFLVKEPALTSLFAIQPILSMVLHTLIQGGFQVGIFLHIKSQPWFEPFVDNPDDNYFCYENGVVFCISMFQYITLAVVFSKGTPYRKTIFSNWAFLFNLIIVTLASAYVTIYPAAMITEILELRLPESMLYRLLIVGLAVANFLVSLILESYIIDNKWLLKNYHKCKDSLRQQSLREYKKIDRELLTLPDWPPVQVKPTPSPATAPLNDATSKHHETPEDVSIKLSINHDAIDAASDQLQTILDDQFDDIADKQQGEDTIMATGVCKGPQSPDALLQEDDFYNAKL